MAKTTYKAKARKFIKYGGKFINEGEEFDVKIADAEEMKKHADMEIPKRTTPPPVNTGEGKGEDPNKKSDDGKMPEDLEKSILNRVENKERETAKRILNKNSYSMPQSNDKDW